MFEDDPDDDEITDIPEDELEDCETTPEEEQLSAEIEEAAKQIGVDKSNRAMISLIANLISTVTRPHPTGTARSELDPRADRAIDELVMAACARGKRIFELDCQKEATSCRQR